MTHELYYFKINIPFAQWKLLKLNKEFNKEEQRKED